MGTSVPKGALWRDNRGAVLSGRKGPMGSEEIPKKTRHVALRFAKVLPEYQRLWFCPTELQRADGLTKSGNSMALRNVFHTGLGPPMDFEDENGDEDIDCVPAYISFVG